MGRLVVPERAIGISRTDSRDSVLARSEARDSFHAVPSPARLRHDGEADVDGGPHQQRSTNARARAERSYGVFEALVSRCVCGCNREGEEAEEREPDCGQRMVKRERSPNGTNSLQSTGGKTFTPPHNA